MAKIGLRSRFGLVFDGQSLNNVPGALTCYPNEVMPLLPFKAAYKVVALNGISWTELATTAEERWAPYVSDKRMASSMALVMCGGQTDIWGGDSGAQVYADEVAYAAAARSAGFDRVYAMTTVPNVVNTSPMNDARIAHNTLLLADASNAFDGVGDVANDAVAAPTNHLADYTNTTYYSDGVHWVLAATTLVAAIMEPVLATLADD